MATRYPTSIADWSPKLSSVKRLGRIGSCVLGDWRGWDFQHRDGCRLEVKQSAARQTWTGSRAATKPVFDIRARTGYFEGANWIADPRRFADIYVFALHPILDDTADHCDPDSGYFMCHVQPFATLQIYRSTEDRNVVGATGMGKFA